MWSVIELMKKKHTGCMFQHNNNVYNWQCFINNSNTKNLFIIGTLRVLIDALTS